MVWGMKWDTVNRCVAADENRAAAFMRNNFDENSGTAITKAAVQTVWNEIYDKYREFHDNYNLVKYYFMLDRRIYGDHRFRGGLTYVLTNGETNITAEEKVVLDIEERHGGRRDE